MAYSPAALAALAEEFGAHSEQHQVANMLVSLGEDFVGPCRHSYGPTGARSYWYRCRNYDTESRLCTAYDSRPDMCRNYPYRSTCRYLDCAAPYGVAAVKAAAARAVACLFERGDVVGYLVELQAVPVDW